MDRVIVCLIDLQNSLVDRKRILVDRLNNLQKLKNRWNRTIKRNKLKRWFKSLALGMLGLSNGYNDCGCWTPVIVVSKFRWSWFLRVEFWYALVSLFAISPSLKKCSPIYSQLLAYRLKWVGKIMGLIMGEILGEIFSLESRYLAHLADLVFQTTKSRCCCLRWARWTF